MHTLPRVAAALATVGLATAGLIVAPTAVAADVPVIRLTEIESNGGVPGDWIELHNPGTAAVALDGFIIKDDDDAHAWVFPAGSILEPGAFLSLDQLDSKTGLGQFDFGLGAKDSVRLFTPDGVTVVDAVSWTAHASTTLGRDSAQEWRETSEATRGAENLFATEPAEPGEPGAPAEPTGPTAATVVVNEIVYDKISGVSQDSIELFNAGAAPVDLTGWTVADDKRTETGDVPAVTLAPGAFLVLTTDVDFPFGLGKGDEVVLFDAAGTIVDSFAYANTAPLATWARCPDGTGEWGHATAVTLGSANVCAVAPEPGAVVLNEVDSGPSDWVELYNPGSTPFALSGFELRDNSDDHRWQFPIGSSIAPGQFLVVSADTVGIVDGAPARFDSAIGIGSADEIRLFDSAGILIDRSGPWSGHAAIDGDQITATLARCPDGVGTFVLAYATPGESNRCVAPDVAINEIESNGDATDWAEIINTGATAIDISGWTMIDNDPIGHAADVTPVLAGTVLAPGELYVFDQNTHFGFGLGAADSVSVRDATGTIVAEHSWTAHAQGVYGRCPDGLGEMVDLELSTKGLRNACGNPVRINEVESDGGTPGDWIELVNPTASVLDVSGIIISDDDDTHTYTIPAGTTIAAGGYLVIDGAELGFGLGGGDSVRLFEGGELRDATSWAAGHAAVTWGRCPDTSGAFAVTAASTKGERNVCAGEIAVGPWPGGEQVRVLDPRPTFLADSSGLDTQLSADGLVLWAVDNGTGTFWKLRAAADGQVAVADGWSDGKRARFQKDAAKPAAAGPDAEGITVDDTGFVYLAVERDNSAKAVNLNVVLKVDPSAAGPDVVATQEWDLTGILPAVGANLGMEAVEWIPDSVLAGTLWDDATGKPFVPTDYRDRGNGLFFVAVEDTGDVYAFALGNDGSAVLVSTIETGLPAAMALDFDEVLGALWVVCDDGCEGRSAQIRFTGTASPDVRHIARPAGLPNINNEGFATAPAGVGQSGERPVWWFADGFASGALRAGSLPGAVTPGGPGGPGLPGSGGVTPLPGDALTPANAGGLVLSATTVVPGQTIRITTTAQPGTAAEVWMYSVPQRIGAGVIATGGIISAVIPRDAAAGAHRIAVYAADGTLLGWATITVVSADQLAATGGIGTPDASVALALGAVVLGTVLFAVGRRRVRPAE